MSELNATAGAAGGGHGKRPPTRAAGTAGGGLFQQYKQEQGIWTRRGTFLGAGALIAWGAYFLFGRLTVYEGDEAWTLLITHGVPILFLVMVGAVVYWVSFVHRKSSDFMIATEGEMKKVNWSSKREVIGSTKVVIIITMVLAVLLFVVDLVFQALFTWLGVLKVG